MVHSPNSNTLSLAHHFSPKTLNTLSCRSHSSSTMFSPGNKRSNRSSVKDRPTHHQPPPRIQSDNGGSPVTPLTENRRPVPSDNSIPNRPTTGTPAPWTSRLSVLARIPQTKKSDKVDEVDSIQPVYVGEFPQVVRDEQANILQRRVSGDAGISGGMDKGTSLAWIICRSRLFIWSYLLPAASRNCVILDIPHDAFENGDVSKSNSWLLCVVDWDKMLRSSDKFVQQRYNASILLCNRKTRALIYWPDIYPEEIISQVTYFSESETGDVMTPLSKQLQGGRTVTAANGSSSFNSLIVSSIPRKQKECIALACSNGQLWQFHCSCASIKLVDVHKDIVAVTSQRSDGGQLLGSKGYPRSLTWHFPYHSLGEAKRQFFLLTDHEIQCFSVSLSPNFDLIKLWSHEIISSDGDFGIQKGLAGQKRIWPLDLQIDSSGKVITVLIATFCKDRATSSNYTEYSLLTMQYKSGLNISLESNNQVQEKILEKKAPIQVIIPKARVEDEDFLFSMRLRVGGKPSGSSIVLSGDGTATVTHYWRNSSRLYQFDLPYDAGKVVDASVFPSDDGEDGAWAVLTEKAGVWAIPEKAVLLGGVEPPERSLSRKGSSNEGSSQEERRNFSFAGTIAPRRASSEAWDAGDNRQRAVLTGIARRTAQDEESEALLAHLFHDFLSTGQVTGALDKLKNSGAFERDGETNVFARVSKSIIDTLAKHWTTTRGAEIVALAVVSTQLLDKQQKHQKFLQFLALSKCHEELCSKQRQSLQIIMEHGEKLSGMIQLRELQNMIRQQVSSGVDSYSTSENVLAGPLWDLIQFVGERARQNTVLLMDRDNTEVFYSKVSELEEVFHCLERQRKFIISEEMPLKVQLQRVCELSNACVTILRTAMQYKNENHMWYPSPEGLTPWYCQTVVRSGLWSVASFMLHRSDEASCRDRSASLDFHTHLEVLTELVLEAYSGAITAKVERQEDHKGLSAEYSDRRDTLLDSLHQQVKGFLQFRYQDSGEGTEELNEENFRELSSKLLSIAKRHEGYQTLWNLCCDLNDTDLLRSLMHDSMGPRGGFSYFVFKQMYASKQLSKLLRLGEEFPEDFATFSKQHPDLLWLHEVYLHQFSSTSETLHSLALSEGDSSILESENIEIYDSKIEPTLADRKRLLNLSKIAVMAGKNADYDTKLKRIEADLKILKLQEEILKLIPEPEKQEIGQKLLPPAELIKLCLKAQNRELSLRAFDVFAWTSSSFLKNNTSLLEECWRNAANQDEWEEIHQMTVAEGLSDKETLWKLRETVLFQASSRCYGPEAETYEGGFEEELPLRQESSEVPLIGSSSVEAILMQHRSFPDADKLMVTTIMLGSLPVDPSSEEGPAPME